MFELYIEKRRIIPIRAIPEVTGRDMGSVAIVEILAKKQPEYHSDVSLDAFHFDPDGKHHKMFPREWDVVIADLERLLNKLGKEVERWRIHHPVWREKSIAIIPYASFAWWDDFVIAHTAMFPTEYKIPFDDRPGYQEINEHPHLNLNISKLVYEGFDTLLPTENIEFLAAIKSQLPLIDMSERDILIGLIAREIRSTNPGIRERKVADKVYDERRRKGPKPERLRQIIREFQFKVGQLGKV